ncbi:MAG: DHH family phosphoesterase [Erysipelotrichaceae bacterium]|nr:DHH family phosphoesterase [Erysipelotrichaceae bacterium]
MKRNSRIIAAVIVIFLLLAAAVAVSFFVLHEYNYLALIVLLVSFVSVIILYIVQTNYHKVLSDDIESSISSSMSEALKEGEMGILVYNEEYEITWLSAMFYEKQINRVGEKVLVWLPELQDLLSGKAERTVVVINEDKYEVSKKDDAYVLFFKDISKEYDLEKEVNDKAYVLGLVNFDNFDEASLNENDVAYINSNIRVPVLEYFRKFGIVFKTLRNNRLQLILNDRIYHKLLDDRFSILNKVRREAKAEDMDVTLSMAFAYGSDDLTELDEVASGLLEIAETRGGDQVVTRKIGDEAIFYGGSSEARERQSKVKIRVVANTIRRMINDASNVMIVGHIDADGDCIGSALAMSLIVRTMHKDTYIVLKNSKIEPMIHDVLVRYNPVLSERHSFVTESEAISHLDDDSLVIMVDHHAAANSSCRELLKAAKNIVIIDHHRRRADLDVDASFLYVEAGASSATELVVEMFPYFSRNIDIVREEANIMYIGLLIDTNHFRSRVNSRTFDVARTLKQYGADSAECEELIEEPYEMTKKRYEILAQAKRFRDNIMIANMKESYPRSVASQAVDIMIDIKEIDCAFVIWKISSNEVAVSARSKGNINVQVILEKLGGGGHMTAAGLQTKEYSQDELYNKLLDALNEYLESVEKDESDTA